MRGNIGRLLRRAASASVILAAASGAAGTRAHGQVEPICDCASQLQSLAEATRANYAGYGDKTGSPADSAALERHLALLSVRATHTLGAECADVLEAYIGFFEDGHLRARFTGPAAAAAAGVPAAPGPVPESSGGSLEGRHDPILGTWENAAGGTRIEIVPAPAPWSHRDRYAVVRSSAEEGWRVGDVRATFVSRPDEGIYHGEWFFHDRPPEEWVAVVLEDTLLLTGFEGWRRVEAGRPVDTVGADPLRPRFRRLSSEAGLLTVPSMQVQYGSAVDSLVRARASDLAALDLLVIDVRGNQGGGDGTYEPLLPLLYTDTIVTGPGSVLSSPANIAYYERFLDPEGVDSPAWVVEMLEAMRARPGEQIALPPAKAAYERVLPQPRAVAILQDRTVASATETFLLKARQSAKVRLFGQPSAGVVDYLNQAWHSLACGVVLQAPTIRRSLHLPADSVDDTGIAPDVVLPLTAEDPIGTILRHY